MRLDLWEVDAMVELIHEKETYAVIGAVMEVHKVLGCGFLEGVYQEALAKEFLDRGIPFVSQKELPVFYKEQKLNKAYIAGFVYSKRLSLRSRLSTN
jgi:GxxExxY protein